MAASVYQLGRGATFSVATTAVGTATPVNQLKSITFSGSSNKTEDITSMSSPGSVMEIATTVQDPGKAALSGVFDFNDPGQLELATAFEAIGTLLYCTLQFLPQPNTAQTVGYLRTFTAYVTEFNSGDAQFDKTSALSCTLTITGQVVNTAGH